MSSYQSRPVFNYPLTNFGGDNQAAPYLGDQNYAPYGIVTPSAADVPRGMRYSDSKTVNPRALLQQSPDPNYRQLSNYTTTSIPGSSGSASNSDDYFPSTGTSPDMLSRKLDQRPSRGASTYVDAHGVVVEVQRSQRYFCDVPGCIDDNGNISSVSRKADLKRHMDSVHKDPYIDCDYRKCLRKGKLGFCRQDHYREHLRGYHNQVVETKENRRRSS